MTGIGDPHGFRIDDGNENYIGYIKYEGKLVENGLMDARKQAQALLGFDSALRYFLSKQAPELRNLDFEIPVRIKKGSWEALIPDTVAGWVQGGFGDCRNSLFHASCPKDGRKRF